ncbi:M50 family metallopeptidase [Rhizohabitans arisaemae]|uniref:M50 family metallopeptidase n=1 Tax=Rhizohabitans arisaemae TaxID=2720610 RepID=UPI0024B1E344|nr:M50 family metallopeptidase [Rhizohabitans arisaemae]
MDTSLGTLWKNVIGLQPEPPLWIVVVTGIAALAVVVYRPGWHASRGVVTIAHEGGHALVALLTGRRLEGIRLHSDTSGVTLTRGRPRGLGMILTAAAGYVAPSLLGFGGAWLISSSRITVLLWIMIVLLAGMLVMIRNFFGVVSILATGGALFAVSWFAPMDAQGAAAYLAVWFLLFGGVRPITELWSKRSRRQAPNSDAEQLARLTGVPALLWVALFLLIAVAALAVGGYWLVYP